MAYDIKLAKLLAREALMILTNEIVLPGLVHRNYESEIGKVGKTIEIIVPPTFTANAMDNDNGITIQDPDEDSIEMTLDHHEEVSFGIRDLEATVSDRPLLMQYMKPAMIPLVERIETTGMKELTYNITNQACIAGVTDAKIDADKIVDIRTKQRENKVPLKDLANLHGILSPVDEGALLKQEKFTSADFAAGGEAMRRAFLGQRYGYNYWPTQLVERPTPGDASGAVNLVAGYEAGATTLVVDGLTAAPPEGTLLTFAEHSSVYVVDAGTTTTSLKLKGGGLTDAVADDEVITFLNVNQNVFFHKNAIALATRPLGKAAGKENTGSTIYQANYEGYGVRVEIFRDHKLKKDVVSIDCLWGWKILNQLLAFKYYTQK
jgi:hypothetical protein